MAFTLNFADTTAFTTALDDAALPNGIAALISDAGDGTPGWFYLDQASAIATETGRVYATQSGTGRWIRVGLTAADLAGGMGIGATEPDPTNPDGWSVHYQEVASPPHNITRAWNGSAWVVVAATPIHGEWGSDGPPIDGAMPGHVSVDYTDRTRYEWMNDLGMGYTWVNIGTF